LGALTALVSAAAAILAGVPIVGALVQWRRWSPRWVPLGPVAGFTPGETRLVTFTNPIHAPWDGLTSHQGVYVRYAGRDAPAVEQFLVLAANCAHLGCPVSWFPQSGLFMCPCHGGVYYANGERASGPPPRGLFVCVWRVQDGQLEIEAPHYPTLQDALVPTT
jgi:nitrite reductase/ring-hydroxylating ferredoxin subunit